MKTIGRWLTIMLCGTRVFGAARADAGGDIRAVDQTRSAVGVCQAAKLTTASKEIAGKMKCAASASQTGEPIDDACLAKAATRADAGYARAGTLCVGDAGAFHVAVDGCTAVLVADAPGNGRCPAASRKTLGKGAATGVKCQATEIVAPGTFAICDTRQAVRTTAGIARAGNCGQASTATLAADVDACRSGLQDVIVPTTTTTTTTSISATTTTSPGACNANFTCQTPIDCGDGFECVVDASHHCACAPTPGCNANEYPTCGGNCPDGQTCVAQYLDGPIARFRFCACVPPDFSCAASGSQCGYGACPPGSACNIGVFFPSCIGTCTDPP